MSGKIFLILCLWNGSIKVPTLGLKFPENFIFSASTSSYQIEGAWNVDGKGESIWDRFTHTRPDLIKGRQNGDDAAKSYYFYKNDSDLAKEIGFDMYRFSISWTRILPNGDLSIINPAGVQHYDDMINDLLEKNIEPMVTIYHWDLPQNLQDYGGWLNSSIVDHMKNYADILFTLYGDRVKWWITINEPYMMLFGYTFDKWFAPALGLGTPSDYTVTHNMLLAHMQIYRLYESKYKPQQKGKISISLSHESCIPETQSQEDLDAEEIYFQFSLGIFAHPIYSAEGDYPQLVRETVYNNSIKEGKTESRLPVFTDEQKSSLIGTSDYFGLNHYSSFSCGSLQPSGMSKVQAPRPFYQDMNVRIDDEFSPLPTTQERSDVGINAKAFRKMLNRISKEYGYPAIFITENGYNGLDEINDTSRIDYHKSYLTELLNAYYYDKCNITGYTVWSLLDNFEWARGYEPKFGIVSVDYSTKDRNRTRKQSSYFFETLIKNRELFN